MLIVCLPLAIALVFQYVQFYSENCALDDLAVPILHGETCASAIAIAFATYSLLTNLQMTRMQNSSTLLSATFKVLGISATLLLSNILWTKPVVEAVAA